jgi:hypothetical protein
VQITLTLKDKKESTLIIDPTKNGFTLFLNGRECIRLSVENTLEHDGRPSGAFLSIEDISQTDYDNTCSVFVPEESK